MHCPVCQATDTRVIDSRVVEQGAAIRRRRCCTRCADRFTTFERFETRHVTVVKRSGEVQAFSQENVVSGVLAASKGRPVTIDQAVEIAGELEDLARLEGYQVSSDWVGRGVLDRLRRLDEVAWLRFASVYKNFEHLDDFEREAGLIKRS